MLTDAKIAGIKGTPAKPTEYPDGLVPGLRLRVTTTSKRWIVRARMGGKVRAVTLGEYGQGDNQLTLAGARIKAVEIMGGVKEGVIPQPASPRRDKSDKALTVSAAVDLFIDYCRDDRGVKRPESYRWMMDKYVLPAIGEWQIKAVTKADLRTILERVKADNGVTSARRVGGVVRRLFRWAAQEDHIAADPASTLRLPGKETVRERTLSDAEIKALWHVTDPANDPQTRNKAGRIAPHPSQNPWAAFHRLALVLGQRRGEIAAMRWSKIDLKAGTWALGSDETKSARAQLVPLPRIALDILNGIERLEDCDHVLTTTGDGPIRDFSGAKLVLDAAMAAELAKDGHKLEGWRFHDLRRTCSTNLAALKVDPFIRKRVLNHALEGLDRAYDRHDYLGEKRAALDLWADRLAEVVSTRPGGGDNVVKMKRKAKA
jgi:integrase